jgi:D-tyrosyl-tRNA(Tyr) deacylase
MRAVVQRVRSAAVSVDGQDIAAIGPGLLVLLGVAAGDSERDFQWLVDKVAHLRVFSDAGGRMNLDTATIGGAFLVVSQFTLLADLTKGRRPHFLAAEAPEIARATCARFVQELASRSGCPVHCGQFGADMQVSLVNDGPVTIPLDSRQTSPPAATAG